MNGPYRIFRNSQSWRHHAPLWLAAFGGCVSVVGGRKVSQAELDHDNRATIICPLASTQCEAFVTADSTTTKSSSFPSPSAATTTTGILSSTPAAQSNHNDIDDEYPNFSRHGSKAVLPKILTPQVYHKLKHLKTPTFGVTLEDCISAGTMLPYGANPPRGIAGVYAGDADCYTVFAPLLLPLVEEYHGVSLEEGSGLLASRTITRPAMKSKSFSKPSSQEQQDQSTPPRHRKPSRLKRHETNLDPEQILDTQLDPSGEYILYTRMRLARNLEGFAFAPALKRADRRRIERLFQSIVEEDFQPLQGGAYVSIHRMTNQQHEHYMSRRMCFLDPDEFKLAAGLGRDWPDGRGIYCCSQWDPSVRRRHVTSLQRSQLHEDQLSTDIEYWEENPPNVMMWCNYDDHFWVISVNKGGNVQSVFTCLSDAVRQLELSLVERNHAFCLHPKLGFLTSSPTNVGTALRASMSIKLVRLGKEHPALFQEILERLHLEAKSDYAETDQRYTGIFDIANAERLGRTEVQWINIMIQGVQKLIELEKKLERGEKVTVQDVDNVVKDVKQE